MFKRIALFVYRTGWASPVSAHDAMCFYSQGKVAVLGNNKIQCQRYNNYMNGNVQYYYSE